MQNIISTHRVLRNALLALVAIAFGVVGVCAVLLYASSMPAKSLRADLEALGSLASTEIRTSLLERGFSQVGDFTLVADATDFCDIDAPNFPQALHPHDWMTNGDLRITCWDGARDHTDANTFWRVCLAPRRPVGHIAVAHIWSDMSGGTWEGAVLPEDSTGRCQQ